MWSANLHSLRQNRDKWSLADDRQLCCILEEINSSLSTKIDDATDAMQTLVLQVANIGVQVSSLNNRLSSFAADQFIENRVADETMMSTESASKNQTTSLEKQAEAAENLHAAVCMGIELMRTRFKRIEMHPKDFDEGDDPTFIPEPIYEPYDESLARPLPYLIGTSEWISSSTAGISEDCVETTKVSEDVIISLPTFTQPQIAISAELPSSNSLADKTTYGINSQATPKDFNDYYFETKNSCTREYDDVVKVKAKQKEISQALLQKEGYVGRGSGDILHLPRENFSQRSLEHEVFVRNLGLEVSLERSSPLSVRKVEEDQSETNRIIRSRKSSSVGHLFIDSSEEDDLFNDSRDPSAKTTMDKGVSAFTDDTNNRSQMTSSTFESVNSQKLFSERNDDAPSNVEIGKRNETFREKLSGIYSREVLPSVTSDIEKYPVKDGNTEEMTEDELRSEEPAQPSVLCVWKRSNQEKEIKCDVKIGSSLSSMNDDEKQIGVKTTVGIAEERHLNIQQADIGKNNFISVNNTKPKSGVSSIFSSESDDDIFFSSPSTERKIDNAVSDLFSVEKKNSETTAPSLSSLAVERSLPMQGVKVSTSKKGLQLRNLFDSDEEFDGKTVTEGEVQREQQVFIAAGFPRENIQEPPAKENSGAFEPKKPDIFADDSDDDLFA